MGNPLPAKLLFDGNELVDWKLFTDANAELLGVPLCGGDLS